MVGPMPRGPGPVPGFGRAVRCAVVLAVLVSTAAVAPTLAPQDARAASGYSIDLATPRDHVAQTNFVQCVGASIQMMANLAGLRDDRTAVTQRRLQDLARSLSGPRPDGRERRGAGIRGWTAGLNHLGVGPYRAVGEASLQDALRTAARAIRMTGRPVGLLVWRGRHAWVMSGFRATADPATTDDFRVTAAYILDPLYPHGSSTWGPSPRPGRATTVEAVGRQFVARGSGTTANRWMSAALAGKWVMVLPVELPSEWAGLRIA